VSKGPLSKQEAETVTDNYFLTFFNMVSGSKGSEQLVDLYTEECHWRVSSGMDGLLPRIALLRPALTNMTMDSVHVGPLNIESSGDSATITPKNNLDEARVKFDGKWLGLSEFASTVGLERITLLSPSDQPFTMQRESGRWLLSDCKGW
jgi:hypothetical protein